MERRAEARQGQCCQNHAPPQERQLSSRRPPLQNARSSGRWHRRQPLLRIRPRSLRAAAAPASPPDSLLRRSVRRSWHPPAAPLIQPAQSGISAHCPSRTCSRRASRSGHAGRPVLSAETAAPVAAASCRRPPQPVDHCANRPPPAPRWQSRRDEHETSRGSAGARSRHFTRPLGAGHADRVWLSTGSPDSGRDSRCRRRSASSTRSPCCRRRWCACRS